MWTMDERDCEPFITRYYEWDNKYVLRTHKFMKTFTSNKRVEEAAVINNGPFRLEFASDKNIPLFNECHKTLLYGNTELFTNPGKTLEDTRNNLWNNLTKSEFEHDSNNIPGLHTTANFKLALKKYQESIINKAHLCGV
jgi:hypothetical protein